jgi:hypothetical protein
MKSLDEVPEPIKDLLRMSRVSMEMFESAQNQILQAFGSITAAKERLGRHVIPDL